MKRLPLDTALTLMRWGNVPGYGFDLDELINNIIDQLQQHKLWVDTVGEQGKKLGYDGRVRFKMFGQEKI